MSTVGGGAVPTSKLVRSFEVVRSRGSSAGSETKSKVLVVSTLNAADMPVLLLVTVKSVDDPDAVIVGNHPVRRTFETEDRSPRIRHRAQPRRCRSSSWHRPLRFAGTICLPRIADRLGRGPFAPRGSPRSAGEMDPSASARPVRRSGRAVRRPSFQGGLVMKAVIRALIGLLALSVSLVVAAPSAAARTLPVGPAGAVTAVAGATAQWPTRSFQRKNNDYARATRPGSLRF